MKISIYKNRNELGKEAANIVARTINKAIRHYGETTIILATGTSQFEMFEHLIRMDINWSKVTAFHLDEYIGLPVSHSASFCKYLRERFETRVSGLGRFHYIDGNNPNPAEECSRLSTLISDRLIDLVCLWVGENGHLAFNDPPADIETDNPYLIVELDEACRRQQLGEGWFPTFDAVPRKAISMSIRQILKSKTIVCLVPDKRKAEVVWSVVKGEISPLVPASILRTHEHCHLLLDEPSTSLLN